MLKVFNFKKTIIFLIALAFLTIPTIVKADEAKISFMYLYGDTTTEYIQQFQLTNGSVNIVSPNYFELDTKGNLIVSADKTLTNFMQQKSVKVVPFLSNHWDQKKAQLALENPSKLANSLKDAVLTYNLDGVNIDLENLTFADRDQLTEFTRILKNMLEPYGKTVSIAVGAIDKPTSSGWKSAYDLKSLSQVVDYIIIMAYDQHWRTSSPGPVASLPWIQAQLNYMLTQIPKEKAVLGVPFYGRIWTNGQNGGGIWYNDTIKAVQENNASMNWHDEYQVPYVKYTKADGNNKEIWFENYQSLKLKVELIHSYDLKGVAAWELGQEDPAIWQDFSTWLTNSPFKDTAGHWAEKEITYLSSQGYLSGRDKYHFDPDTSVNRAEAVAILSRIFDWQATTANPFIDVPNNYWALTPILQAYNNSVIKGISANEFGPEDKLSRAQLAVILQRAFALESDAPINYEFTDVSPEHWAAKEIYILKNLGFVAGKTKTQFAPDQYVTRAELAAMLARIIQ